jgi:cell division protein FtsI/penicillin-binding protein 2
MEDNFWQMRLRIVLGLFILLFGVIILRLFQKQILQFDYYKALAKQQYTTTKELPPSRGKIYVKDGYGTNNFYPIAINKPSYQVLVVPKNVKDPRIVAESIAPIIEKNVDEIYDGINNNRPYIPPIVKKLTKEQAKKIETLNLEGVLLIPEEWRYYPEKRMASHVIGYVNLDQMGQYGIEGYWDEYLKGESGTLTGEKSSWGNIISSGIGKEPKNGDDLYLTIDRVIQFHVYQKLREAVKKYAADQGTIIVADPRTGAILAMASYPDFDPNYYYKTKDVKRFNNPAIADAYEPGSVFKVVAMAAALDAGKVKPETQQNFGRCVKVGIETICTSTGRAYGNENMTQILENSDNVGMVWVADQMDNKTFYNYMRDFGFGSFTDIDIDTEAKGELLTLSSWREINKATISFGQGIAVTPLQMIQALNAIANQGKMMQPYLVEKRVESSGEEHTTKAKLVRQVISEDIVQKVKEMMVSVVDNGFGRKAQVAGYRIAGKTGTAEVPVAGRGYSEDINIISFGGFAPADNPRFAMLVKLDNPKGAPWSSEVAAPVWGDIAKWLLRYLQIAPTR